ncbi:hypothetical protein [Streptomyces sp. NBC_00353]|uniref:hypothetical protein n=1 Tax=unclassified Streptomyces TaxID=2593676 RepID=UPI002E269A1F
MASIVPRRNKAGEILSYQLKWKDGGTRSDRWRSERFDDEDSAKVFKAPWRPLWSARAALAAQGISPVTQEAHPPSVASWWPPVVTAVPRAWRQAPA